jgi:nitrite reductase (NAD(P)H)
VRILNIKYISIALTRLQGLEISYDICVFATGSQAAIPPWLTPSYAETIRGIFSYRNVADLERMIEYSRQQSVKNVAVVGGGLLGLEAAKAISDLNGISGVTIVERNKWVHSSILYIFPKLTGF